MDRMGFDGWQGDTIGDNRVTDYEHRNSTDEADSHMMSDSYASFINAMKDSSVKSTTSQSMMLMVVMTITSQGTSRCCL